jgi:hypothetical protein
MFGGIERHPAKKMFSWVTFAGGCGLLLNSFLDKKMSQKDQLLKASIP